VRRRNGRRDKAPAKLSARQGALGRMRRGQGSHERGRQLRAALHINTIMSPIPTRVYKPATVTPR
jgi:hypothetical protein